MFSFSSVCVCMCVQVKVCNKVKSLMRFNDQRKQKKQYEVECISRKKKINV